jgi:predicted nuclease of predicted toxin-antitoxin system
MVRILLDHCVPVGLSTHIRGHDVESVRTLGWHNLDDRQLLDRAENDFDVLVTVDGSMRFQQALTGRRIALIVLVGQTNRLQHLARLVPGLSRALQQVSPGGVLIVRD